MKIRRLVAFAVVALVACFSVFAAPLKRAQITISGYSGETTLENFPVLVRVSESVISGFSYVDCQADGSDISFALEDGTVLAHEIDTWDTTGESLVWVKLPALAGTDTSFYFRWNDTAPLANNPSAVWSAGYAGVWHMNGASGSVSNANGNENLNAEPKVASKASSTDLNSCSIGVEGLVGTARQTGINNQGSYLSIPAYDNLNLGSTFTISGWIKFYTANGYARLFSRKASDRDSNGWESEMTNGSDVNFKARGASATSIAGKFPVSLVGNWVHVSLVYNDAELTVYANGTKNISGTITAATDNGKPLSIGCDSDGNEAFVKGMFDECRLQDGAASADWVKAEYETVSKEDFLVYGSAETILSGEIFLIDAYPSKIGSPSPDYGAPDIAVGSELTLSMPVTEVPGEGTVTNYLAGWKLEKIDGETGELSQFRSSSDEGEALDSYTYTHADSSQFTWLWDVRDMLGIDGLSVVTNGGNHLKFTVDVSGIGYTAPSATLKLCYGIVPGEFVWTNIVSAAVTEIGSVVEAALSDLTPGVYYYVKAVLETNDEAKDTVETEVVGIRTDPSVESDAVSPVTELHLDGSGSDSLIVSGTLSSSLDSACTLTILVGDSPETMTNAWAGSTVASGGAFSFTLGGAEPGTAKYLAPRSTYYVSVIAMTAGGTVLISPAATVTMSPKTYWVYTEESVSNNGTGYGYVTDGVWHLYATRTKNTMDLTVSGETGKAFFYGLVPSPMDFSDVRNSDGEKCRVTQIGGITHRNSGRYLYDYADMLTELIAPDCVGFTYNYNFNVCTSLTNVVLNEDFTSTTEAGFSGCSSLTTFSPRILKCSLLQGRFFMNCKKLAGVLQFPACTKFKGQAFYSSAIEEVHAPLLTVIDGEVFSQCQNLTTVTSSNALTQVGYAAFSGCTSLNPGFLEKILNKSIQYIGASDLNSRYMGSEFNGCTSLAGPLVWNFPDMATNVVNGNCFLNCSSLGRVEFKTPVVEFRSKSFYNIKPGAELYMHADVPSEISSQAIVGENPPYPRVYLKDNVDGWLEAFGKYHHVIRKEDFANEEFSVTPEVPACGNHPTRTWQNMVAKMALDTEVCDSEKDGNTVTKVTMLKKGVIGFLLYHQSNHTEQGCWIFRVPETGFKVIVR